MAATTTGTTRIFRRDITTGAPTEHEADRRWRQEHETDRHQRANRANRAGQEATATAMVRATAISFRGTGATKTPAAPARRWPRWRAGGPGDPSALADRGAAQMCGDLWGSRGRRGLAAAARPATRVSARRVGR